MLNITYIAWSLIHHRLLLYKDIWDILKNPTFKSSSF